MRQSLVEWLKGTVEVELRSAQVAQFLNQATVDKLELFNIRLIGSECVRFEISVEQYFLLRKYVRASGGKLKLVGKKGFPFLLALMEKRLWFAVGITAFFAIIFLLASLVWSIEVAGNKRIPSDVIIAAAKEEGLYRYQWSFKLQDTDVLSKKLVNAIPGTTWIGVEKVGTKVKIQIVESTIPDQRELHSPRHLVASNDAVITYIIAEQGKPLVRKNTRVKKGDVLISGIIGSEAHSQIVIAQGTVKGLVWYEYEVSAPLVQKYRVLTGERQSRSYIVLGDRALQISGFKQEPYEKSETTTTTDMLSIGKYTLPIGKMKELEQEATFEERELTVEEAKAESLEQARLRVLAKAGKEAEIVSEIVLHEATDNGKVVMKVLYEVNQSITKEQPIVHMQGD
ncbi:sporulation protein YqfD [Paenibacillus septentrionalis]|uniref:Sporulation protein YqfD n=1 Tax=Paenibacillus septentrionalis TaxID=429342 RepID=A0ABW1V126_9BACL